MTERMLGVALATIVLASAVALAVLVGHGAWLAARRGWARPRLARGRAALHGVARGERVGPAELATLRALSASIRTRLLVELSRSLSGSSGEALGALGRELGVVQRAERAVRSPFWHRRLRGARVLTALRGGEDVMLPLFTDRSAAVRAQAAEWAAHHPSPRAMRALLDSLARPGSGFAVRDSLLRLGPYATAPLAGFLAERRGPDAVAALELATALPNPGLLAPALALCDDTHAPTRARALRLLAAVGGGEGVARARAALDDPDAGVRAAAAAALGRSGEWAAAPAIAQRLRDPSWEVRRAAAVALRALGGPGHLLLRRFRDDADPFAADMARQTLDVAGLEENG